MIPHESNSSESGVVRVPICTSSGDRFISFSYGPLDGHQDGPAPEDDQAACHGPCLYARKKMAVTDRRLIR